ncbi:MAG: hypothetical protein KGJ66_03480 [Alphaproteobacteria bacterium]|jgi:ElaB/YqjD/DUF883 family membrane-anchored ribosome-binding protein|nr:hypothetical protein [Alphaproteobacteria bacterium]
MPDTTQPRMQSEIDSLRAEIRQLQANIASLTESVRGVVRAGKAEAVDRVSETADKAWSEAKSLADGLSKQVEEKPVTALVSAFSIGMLLGLMFNRRA